MLQSGRLLPLSAALPSARSAAGLDVRLAIDWSDHIWVEAWSAAQAKWVHLDPCEASADRPLLYEVRHCGKGALTVLCSTVECIGGGGWGGVGGVQGWRGSAQLSDGGIHPLLPLLQAGWGKRLSYVVAVGRHGTVDVTRRYTRKWEEVQQRWGSTAVALAWR